MGVDVTHLAWIDLESTGTNEHVDDIVEIAMIVTDMSLQPVMQYTEVIQPEHGDWYDRMRSIDAVFDMHTKNGLIEDLQSGVAPDLFSVDREIVSILKEMEIREKAIMLAGSGVGHFDARFIRHHMKYLSKHLAYPVIDVGVMRRFVRDVVGRPDMIPNEGDGSIKTHRAMDDIKLHLEEARYYRKVLAQAFDVAGVQAISGEML